MSGRASDTLEAVIAEMRRLVAHGPTVDWRPNMHAIADRLAALATTPPPINSLPADSKLIADPPQPSALALAAHFHETYERLAPSFGYETRAETRKFDPSTPNGRLMVAVCSELAPPQARPVEGAAVLAAIGKRKARLWSANELGSISQAYGVVVSPEELQQLRATHHAPAPEVVAAYEFEVLQDGWCQASGTARLLEDVKAEARQYAMMYGQDGPVEVKFYERRELFIPLTAAQQEPPKC